jgi:hypothetical protein
LFSHSFGYLQKQADFGLKVEASLPDVKVEKIDTDRALNKEE